MFSLLIPADKLPPNKLRHYKCTYICTFQFFNTTKLSIIFQISKDPNLAKIVQVHRLKKIQNE